MIKNRETFYLSGYDPRGSRHYYNLYKKESAKEKEKGTDFHISKRKKTDKHTSSWSIKLNDTKTNYHFLEWDDIIRKDWKKNFFSLFIDMIVALNHYVFSGVIFKYAKASPVQMIAAFYPVAYLLGTIYITYTLSLILYGFLSIYTNFVLSTIISMLVGFTILTLLTKIGNKFAVFWLLRVYTFAIKYVKGDVELENRIEEFATLIANTIQDSETKNIDEILIISHSVGTIITIPILEKAFAKLNLDSNLKSKISILTLGECIPVVSFLPKADSYRESMKKLSSYDDICWIDYTTPIDGACFPLLDYYKCSNIETTNKPNYLSPRFHTLFSKSGYSKLRKNRYLTHFVYLMSTELDGVYNFFKISAGKQPLSYYLPKKEQK